MVGPVTVGINRFVLQTSPPDATLIANNDLIGPTAILISSSFMDQKFVQIGYHVNNEYTEEFDPQFPPNPVDISKLRRNILADRPRVTRYAIDWTGQNNNPLLPGGAEVADAEVEEEEEENVITICSYYLSK